MDKEPPKGSKWPAEGLHFIWDLTRAVRTPEFLRGQAEFQSPWVRVAAWSQPRCRAQFLAAAVLGLTQPREVGMFVLLPEIRQNTHFLPLGRLPFKPNKHTN